MNHRKIIKQLLSEALDMRLKHTKNKNLLGFFANKHQLGNVEIEIIEVLWRDMDELLPEDERLNEDIVEAELIIKERLMSPEQYIAFFERLRDTAGKYNGTIDIEHLNTDIENPTKITMHVYIRFQLS